jgi:hypothetical protein
MTPRPKGRAAVRRRRKTGRLSAAAAPAPAPASLAPPLPAARCGGRARPAAPAAAAPGPSQPPPSPPQTPPPLLRAPACRFEGVPTVDPSQVGDLCLAGRQQQQQQASPLLLLCPTPAACWADLTSNRNLPPAPRSNQAAAARPCAPVESVAKGVIRGRRGVVGGFLGGGGHTHPYPTYPERKNLPPAAADLLAAAFLNAPWETRACA